METIVTGIVALIGVSVVGILGVAGLALAQRVAGVGKSYTDGLEAELELTKERYARIGLDLQAAQAALVVAQQHLDTANAALALAQRENDRLRAENAFLRGEKYVKS